MRKIFSYAMLLLCGTLAFTACSDDNDSNPTLVQPTEFSMFQPSVGTATIDLEASKSFELSWTLPVFTNFGAPVVPNFIIQLSPTGSFTTAFDRKKKNYGEADYIEVEQTFNSAVGKVNSEAFNLAIQQFFGWGSPDDVPANLSVVVRTIASVRDASMRDYSSIVSSNNVSLNVIPYFINLAPTIWYMVGNNIGTASWSNTADGAGKGLIPLLPSSTEENVIAHIGYFKAETQFKFVLTPGNWDDQLNYENVDQDSIDAAIITDKDGDNHNIGIEADGYYVVKVNTSTKKIVVKPYEKTVKTFNTMGMPGTQNDWSPAAAEWQMTACETLNGENHTWTATFEADANGKVKFAANGAWDDNWGAEAFPYGTGTQGGPNIPFEAGSYTVFFNDISGQYYFIVNEETEE